MPYIDQRRRDRYDPILDILIERLEHMSCGYPDPGDINYIITQLCLRTLPATKDRRYFHLNNTMGILSCVQRELYRRVVVPHEKKKRKENGDVFDLNAK